MSDRNVTTDVVKDAVTFPRTRLGEPHTIKADDFDRWLADVKAATWDEGWHRGALDNDAGYEKADNPYRNGEDHDR